MTRKRKMTFQEEVEAAVSLRETEKDCTAHNTVKLTKTKTSIRQKILKAYKICVIFVSGVIICLMLIGFVSCVSMVQDVRDSGVLEDIQDSMHEVNEAGKNYKKAQKELRSRGIEYDPWTVKIKRNQWLDETNDSN